MKIAIGKFGRSLFFDKEYRKAGKGDLAPMASYITLARKHPESTFYLIGASDLYKTAKTPELRQKNEIPDNIVDLFAEAKKIDTSYKHQLVCESLVKVIQDNDIKFDYGIFFQGPDFKINTHYIRRDEERMYNPLGIAEHYCGTICHVINSIDFPFIIVNEDPRYVPFHTADMFRDETCVLSHLNAKTPVERYVKYFEYPPTMRPHTIDYIYSGIERTSLLFLKKHDYRNWKNFQITGEDGETKTYAKDGFIFVACNESPNRFKNIKNFILDMYPDVPIYGNWKEETIKGYEDRFVQKSMAYLQDDLWRSKYTYIPGFFDKMTNFVTIKVWEMCIYGIMPFFDKTKYDSDNLLPIPDFFRVSSPQEMKEKIELLESDEALYTKYLNELYDLVEDRYFNGDFIDQVFKPIFDKNGVGVTEEDFVNNAKAIC